MYMVLELITYLDENLIIQVCYEPSYKKINEGLVSYQ
jgi:hypothetical protein